MSSVNDLNFKSELGMEYDNAADYTPQARIKGRFKSFGNLMEKTQQEFDDVDRTFKNLDKALEDYEKQAENLKAPYVDKKVGNIDKNVSLCIKGIYVVKIGVPQLAQMERSRYLYPRIFIETSHIIIYQFRSLIIAVQLH